jgi:hypothetical protein
LSAVSSSLFAAAPKKLSSQFLFERIETRLAGERLEGIDHDASFAARLPLNTCDGYTTPSMLSGIAFRKE